MTITTSEAFLDALEKAQLIGPEALAEARRQAVELRDPRVLGKALIQQGILTSWQAGQLLIGRESFCVGQYQLIDLLGSGGMGHVFLARHTTMNRTVALKRMSKHLSNDPAARDRFLAEARAVATVDHPNIIRAFSVDYEDDRYYMVMEYVEGTDLLKMVEQQGPLDFEKIADYMRQAADGLSHAHRKGLIHCDIKPANLLINSQGVLKILDLGMSRFRDESASPDDSTSSFRGSEQLAGTVDYMAPEQAMGSPDLDHRADIYSLGCTLYFLVSGHAPFPTGTLHEKLLRHQTQNPPNLTAERPGTPPELAEFCERMMGKAPDRRVQTAEDVRRFFDEWRPPSARLRKAVPLSDAELHALERPQSEASAGGPAAAEPVAPRSLLEEELSSLGELPQVPAAPLTPLPSTGVRPAKKETQKSEWPRIVAVSTIAAVTLVVVLITAVSVVRSRRLAREQAVPALPSGGTDPGAAVNPPSVPAGADGKQDAAAKKPPEDVAKSGNSPKGDSKSENKKKGKGKSEAKKKPAAGEKNLAGKKKPSENEAGKTPAGTAEKPPSDVRESMKPEPKNPFADCPNAVELPELSDAEDGRGDVALPPPITLVPIQGESGEAWSLSLQGGNFSRDPPRRLVLEDPTGETDRAEWTVRLDAMQGDAVVKTPVARLQRSGRVLRFEWLEGVAKNPTANQLRNCLLVIKVGRHERRLAMRYPVTVDGPFVDVSKTTTASAPMPWLPDPELIRMEVIGVEGRDDGVIRPDEPLTTKNVGTISYVRTDRQGREFPGATLQTGLVFRKNRAIVELKTLQPVALVWRQVESPGPRNTRVEEVVKHLTQQLAAAQGPQKAAIEKRLALLDAQIWLRDFYRSTHRKGRLQFRIFFTVAEQQVDLMRTP